MSVSREALVNKIAGFDSTVIGSINSMQQYQNFFDLKGESSTKTGVVFVS